MAFLTDVFTIREPVTFSSLAQSFAEFRRRSALRRRTIEELSALSDRELADLDISRYNIREIADETVRRS